MGINCKTYIPLHVRNDYILQVIAKVVGSPMSYATFDKKPFDINQPSSRDNSWHIKFDKDIRITTGHSMSAGNFEFKDAAGQHYSWFLHMENEDEEHKSVSPGSYALSVAVAKRLVDFFGNKALFHDSYDWDNKKYTYFNDNPKFPKKTPEQSSDDRWYQFYNTLQKEPVITARELLEISENFSCSNQCEILIPVLAKLEFDNIDQKLPQKEEVKKSPKLKV